MLPLTAGKISANHWKTSALRWKAWRAVYGDTLHIVYPVHLNPNVQEPVYRLLSSIPNIHLLPPLDYLPIVSHMTATTTRSAVLAVSVLSALIAVGGRAADSDKGASMSNSVQARATVQAIDLNTRTVTLKSEKGEIMSLAVPPEMTKLDQLKVGDVIVANYTMAVAANIAKPGDPMAASGSAVTRSDADASTPAVAASRQVTTRVKVDAIDTKANTVTFTGAKGNKRTVAIKNPDLQQRIRNLKAGDQVDITYTEALALSLDRASPKPQ